jgi:hypothetical protein
MDAFVLQKEELDLSLQKHFNREFLDQNEWEQPWVEREEDMLDMVRTRFHFGDRCPLQLKDGIEECKSFKHNKERYVSNRDIHFATNYLAKQAYESSNHVSNGKLVDAFDEAEHCETQMDNETWDDREAHRRHCEAFSKKADKQMDAPARKKPRIGSAQGGSSSNSSNVKGKGKDDGQGHSSTNVIAT